MSSTKSSHQLVPSYTVVTVATRDRLTTKYTTQDSPMISVWWTEMSPIGWVGDGRMPATQSTVAATARHETYCPVLNTTFHSGLRFASSPSSTPTPCTSRAAHGPQ